jgi:hypothetical protein
LRLKEMMKRVVVWHVQKKKTRAKYYEMKEKRFGKTRFWFKNIYSETGIRSMVEFKNEEQWKIIGMYITKHEEIWEGMIRKGESEVQINLHC